MLERGGPSAAYNLGHGEGISVRQIIDAVGRVMDRPVPHRIGARRPGDPATLIASSGRAKRELEWTPRLSSVDEIIRTAWQWHSRHPQGYAGGAAGRI